MQNIVHALDRAIERLGKLVQQNEAPATKSSDAKSKKEEGGNDDFGETSDLA